MKLAVTHALRLVRQDIFRLTAIHQQQFIKAIAPNQNLERASEDIELKNAEEEDEESFGLLYIRIAEEDTKQAFEGWFIDWERYPSKKTSLDGGCFFKALTVERTSVEMSQSCFHLATTSIETEILDFFKTVLPKLKITLKGAALKSNPPFALAKAPPPILVEQENRIIELEVVKAVRYTQQDIKNADATTIFQFAHSIRPKFAPKTIDSVKGDLFGVHFSINWADPAQEEKAGEHFGLAYICLRNKNKLDEEFEGWFFDRRSEEESAFWPSTQIQLGWGRFFIKGGIEFTGIELEKNKIKIDLKHGLSLAEAFAKGLKKLGLTFNVELLQQPNAGEKGYFHSATFQKQQAAHKAYLETLNKKD